MNSLKVDIKTEAKAIVQILLERFNVSEVFVKNASKSQKFLAM